VLRDERFRTRGLRHRGPFVGVALTSAVPENFRILYLADEPVRG